MTDTYDDSLLCPDCGYSLRGISSDRCPECGLDITFIRENRSVIPWVNRREIGVWRAYWRTVWQVIARRKEFLREVAKPVSYREAAAFRRMTLGFVALAMGIGWVGLWTINSDIALGLRTDFGDLFLCICVGCVLCAVRLQSEAAAAIIIAPGAPPRLLARARTLNIYSVAALALLPVFVGVAIIAAPIAPLRNERTIVCVSGLGIATILAGVLWLLCSHWLAYRVTKARVMASLHGGITILVWIMIFGVVAIGVPASVFWISVACCTLS